VSVAAASLVARAESVGPAAKGGSNAARLSAATTILPAAGGLIALGGPELRRLPNGARRWETLHTVPGDRSYRVASDASGRLLAAWEKEPVIHVFHLFAPGQHVAFPKPTTPGPDVTSFRIDGLELSPDGRDALVFMTGTVQLAPGKMGVAGSSTLVYRVSLDATLGAATRSSLILRVDHSYQLHASPRGAVFAMNKLPGRNPCDYRGCIVGSIVAYEIAGDRATPRMLLDGAGRSPYRARLVRGSDDERIAVMLDVSAPKRLELLRWRYGDASAQFRTLPAPANDDLTTLLITKKYGSQDELVELRRSDDRLELFRHGAAAPEPIDTLGALRSTDTGLHGFGERPDGGLWLHWGDHLGLISPGQPPRAFSLRSLLPPHCEWGGDVFIASPEQLWVGIDGRGRDYARVDLADVGRRARPWR
jgi:hypothetical protein